MLWENALKEDNKTTAFKFGNAAYLSDYQFPPRNFVEIN